MTSKYHRIIAANAEGESDVYDVLDAFNVTNPALAHAIKKMLMPGIRHAKTAVQDLYEARQSLDRAIAMFEVKTPMVVKAPLDAETKRKLQEAFPATGITARYADNPTLTGYRTDAQQATSMAAAEEAVNVEDAGHSHAGTYARAAEANVPMPTGKPERWVLHTFHRQNGWVRVSYLYEYAHDERWVVTEYPEAWHDTNLQPQPDEVPHLLVDTNVASLTGRRNALPWRPRRQADYLVRTMESPAITRYVNFPSGVVWHPAANDFYDTTTLESKGPEFRKTWLSRLEAFPVAAGGMDELGDDIEMFDLMLTDDDPEEEPTPPRPTLMLERKEEDGLTYRVYQVTGPESSKPFKVYRSAVRKGFPKGWTPCNGGSMRKAISAHHTFNAAELWVKNNGAKKAKSV